MDKLEDMLRRQREFQEKYKFHRPLIDWTSAMNAEIGELWEASNGKWWKRKVFTKEERLIELADLFHFFLGFMIDGDITPDELYEAYRKKLIVNYQRQESGTY